MNDLRELFTRIDALQSEFQQPVLVEQFVEGREFYVGVLGNANVRALPVMELDFSGFPAGVPRIASWEAKWGDDGAGSGEQFAGTRSIFPVDVEAGARSSACSKSRSRRSMRCDSAITRASICA